MIPVMEFRTLSPSMSSIVVIWGFVCSDSGLWKSPFLCVTLVVGSKISLLELSCITRSDGPPSIGVVCWIGGFGATNCLGDFLREH